MAIFFLNNNDRVFFIICLRDETFVCTLCAPSACPLVCLSECQFSNVCLHYLCPVCLSVGLSVCLSVSSQTSTSPFLSPAAIKAQLSITDWSPKRKRNVRERPIKRKYEAGDRWRRGEMTRLDNHRFLDAFTHLYERLCPSVSPFVCRSETLS